MRATETTPERAFSRDGSGPATMWRYRDLLPLVPDDPVSLGEGWTPVVAADGLSDETGATVLLKNETVNPTHSYKDRLNALLVSNAVALGETRIATASTGNHGASTAAYASQAGVDDVVVLLPRESETSLRAQVRAYGGEAVVTGMDDRGPLLSALVERGWYPTVNVTEPYTGLPYGYEAYKTVAFELVEQLDGVPDAVAVPAGIGDGLYGIWKGFRELERLGTVDSTPRMIAGQSEERAPLAEAMASTGGALEPDDGPLPNTLSTGGRTSGPHALRALTESGGDAFAVPNDEVERALRDAAREGVFAEPASALAPAAVRRAASEGVIDRGDTVVCVATGAGAKWPDAVGPAVGSAPEIEPNLDALREAVSVPLE